MLGLELHQHDEDAWDSRQFQLIFAMFATKSLEVLIVIGLFLAAYCVMVALAYAVENAAKYVTEVYNKRAIGTSPSARLTQAAFIGGGLVLLVTLGLYLSQTIGGLMLIIILGYAWALFALTVMTIDIVEERKEQGNPVRIPSLDPREYLKWNQKDKTT